MAHRDLEGGIYTDLRNRLTYGGYLCLDQVLHAQQPLSSPPHHDEMLFIIQHQTSELWMKLMVHELEAAVKHVQEDRLEPCFKILSRVKLIQQQLISSWGVLETLTPAEYSEFRGVLGASSGFQSYQYRALEFMLGNKYAPMIDVFSYDPDIQQWLRNKLESPSIYDEFLRYLARHGHAIPQDHIERDWTQPYERHTDVTQAIKGIYLDTKTHWNAYEMCEKLVDVEVNFQVWRFRHMKTVQRTIGFKAGTGGSSGVGFLQKALELTFFPELFDVRTELG